ncbi:MAG TPA: hypothetical protein VG317_16700 [Pseudonocardiaceae bacterium]|jgi:hypothetical protein|nr:hypothetical protein [Pseudonocardiaceae bacterium]
MSCRSACYSRVEPGCAIKAEVHPEEVSFYFGGQDDLILIFGQKSLAEFLTFATEALNQARESEATWKEGEPADLTIMTGAA